MKINFENQLVIKNSEELTRGFNTRYVAEIRHKGLGAYRIIKDLDSNILNNKVEAQLKKWDDQWTKIVDKSHLQAEKAASLINANERTKEARQKQKEIEDLLRHTLNIDDTVDWRTLQHNNKYNVSNPIMQLRNEINKIYIPTSPIMKELPKEPNRSDYEPQFSIFDNIFKSLKEKKILESEESYQRMLTFWKSRFEEINNQNIKANEDYQNDLKKYEDKKDKLIKKYEQLELDWKKQEMLFYEDQDKHNKKIDKMKTSYLNHDPETVIEYCELVLNNSIYPDTFPKDFDIDYNAETKVLLVEYGLPSPDQLPTLLEVKYIATKKELKEIHLSETQLFKIYDITIYNITLRTLHELFEADQSNSIDAIIFNGWVNASNKATGKIVNNCIVSIQVSKPEFIEIELSNIDPKACFKSLKGIGSSKLSGIIAVQPIAQINRNDRRFVIAQDVAEQLNEGSNLAAMDWQDFEHLIREIFEKEFSTNGGEVKVTQASRDGGVDAIAFDPDPIRGGKIVIQAKRYTNTVGVAAVRDLYGTVVNEGATKGILVTTTDYGPDAYDFAKNKPLTLMNGANLLYLLDKHGHKARIDIAEAKRLQM
jgi:restriction system protein